MSVYNTKYNYHDSNIRNILVTIAAEFSNRVTYDLYKDDNVYDVISVPFYNSFTGTEDFLKDEFMVNDATPNFNGETLVDGLYTVVPRGILTYTGLEIDSGSLVNRYIRTQIPKKVDATTYKMYSYETMILPINMTFDVTVICSSWIEMLKILEFGLLKNFYKSTPFYVDYGGYRVRGYINIPEGIQAEKIFEFGFSDKKTFDITFSVDVNTYLPMFDENTEMFLGSRIKSFDLGIFDIKAAPTGDIYSNTERNTNENNPDLKLDNDIIDESDLNNK